MISTPITRIPHLGHKEICLYTLYTEVTKRGGLQEVIDKRYWKEISNVFEFPATCTNAGFTLRVQYLRFLYPYEQKYFFGREDPINEDTTELEVTTRQRRSSRIRASAVAETSLPKPGQSIASLPGRPPTTRSSLPSSHISTRRATRRMSRSAYKQTQEIAPQGLDRKLTTHLYKC